MNIARSTFLFALIGLFLPATSFAQSDYLVNVRGDTLQGQISFQLSGKVEQVYIKRAKRESFPATQIRSVFLKGKRYKPVQYDGSIKFMQILSEDYLSLLAFQPSGVMNYDGRLLQLRDGRILEVPTLGFKKQMSEFLKDDTALADQISTGSMGHNDLDKILAHYNQFIVNHTSIRQAQAKTETEQKVKLDLLTTLKTEIEKLKLNSNQDITDMIKDIEEKLKSNKPVPGYLLKALKANLDSNESLIQLFNEFSKSL